MEIFVLKEKHGDRYIMIDGREITARKILRERLDEGYHYTDEVNSKLETALGLEPRKFRAADWLCRQTGEYERVEIHELEELK